MSAKGLSSRAIIGEFYATLEQDLGTSWINRISNYFTSDQESETYKWLGMSPSMREWVGGRLAKGFRENGLTITNKLFEGTIEVLKSEIDRDKTGQVMVRVREMAQRANSHWAKLMSQLIIDAESKLCYDGQFFFDTDHAEGDSGTQSNDITYDVTTTTAPTPGEMESAILQSIQQILTLKDDQGEPLNEEARSFMVMVPVSFMASVAGALKADVIVDSSVSRSNRILHLGSLGGFGIELAINPRLTWTNKFATFRADAQTSAFIRQEEQGIKVAAIAEGSEEEFKNRRHLYGIEAIRNVGPGYWQRACLTTFV